MAEAGIKISPQAYKAAVTVVTGIFAVQATGEAVAQADIVQEKDSILESLKSQGIAFDDPAIYSLYFDLNSDATSVYWADIVSKPDVFALIQIEGEGEYVLPQISNEYSGQPILDRIVRPEIQAGRKIIIHFMDDDTLSNEIWNSILQSKVNYRIDLNADASSQEKSHSSGSTSSAVGLMKVSISANGTIQLLNSKQIVDAQDYIASMEFTVPASPDGRWLANAKIIDSKGREVGNARFSQIWKPRVPSPQAKVIKEETGKARKAMIIWGGLAIVCGAVFVKLLFFNSEKKKT